MPFFMRDINSADRNRFEQFRGFDLKKSSEISVEKKKRYLGSQSGWNNRK